MNELKKPPEYHDTEGIEIPPPLPSDKLPYEAVVSDKYTKPVQKTFTLSDAQLKALGPMTDERFKLIEEAMGLIEALGTDETKVQDRQ